MSNLAKKTSPSFGDLDACRPIILRNNESASYDEADEGVAILLEGGVGRWVKHNPILVFLLDKG